MRIVKLISKLRSFLNKKTIDDKVWTKMPRAKSLRVLENVRDLPGNVRKYLGELGADNTILFESELAAEKEFTSLVWHEVDKSRLLTPPSCSRTVSDVVVRLIETGYSFEDLSRDLGLLADQHDPEWFRVCCKIYNNFDYDKFKCQPIWLRRLKLSEKEQSPQGNFYILDGCHRTLVLGKLLREENKIRYESSKAILIHSKNL